MSSSEQKEEVFPKRFGSFYHRSTNQDSNNGFELNQMKINVDGIVEYIEDMCEGDYAQYCGSWGFGSLVIVRQVTPNTRDMMN